MDTKSAEWGEVERYVKACVADLLTSLKYPSLPHDQSQLIRGEIRALERLLEDLPEWHANDTKIVAPTVVSPGY